MPYKLQAERTAAQKRWYAAHRAEAAARARVRQLQYRARNAVFLDEQLAEECPACHSTDPHHLQLRRLILGRIAHKPVSLERLRAEIAECPNT